MSTNNPRPSDAIILDIDVCDAPDDICEKYCVADMTIPEFDAMLSDIDARMRAADRGYAKVRFTFAYADADGDECEVRLRTDPGDSSCITSLRAFCESYAAFFRGPRGDENASAMFRPCGTVTGEQAAQLYDHRALMATYPSPVIH